ncbi:hypothetical protein IWQ56_004240 [Coemansia nantahalensis]|uniref:Uncharacterized protein n=2 Tax=Coemansia TaxID=4863 RepID=A0ACC1LBY1_9FUNG|nr:hypothetical protein IWQ56_004240 [Coemansia nantahalensis]KAJ2774334.1 hypothetical protein IWQ57_000871 [Coemansia nantahalensis]KAJ2805572.1 hypothetical protein H4R21_001210 [Coemansia helicoidea]
MELNDASFTLGATVILAYPDDTRVAGYRAALALWAALADDADSMCTAASGLAAVEVLQPLGELGLGALGTGGGDVPVAFANPARRPGLTFCFVSGLPAAARAPELADRLLGLFEKHGVQRVVVPAAANVSEGGAGRTRLWSLFPALAGGGPSGALADALADVARLPAGAQTNDAFLSALSTIAAVAAVGDVGLLIHDDRRPGTSGYRERVVFGAEFADDDDAVVVGELARRLAAAVAAGAACPQPSVEVARVRLGAEAAARRPGICS